MDILKVLLTFVIAYLCGSISFAVIFSKVAGKDVRTMGSGNAGSTNMLRNFGIKLAAFTFAGDFLKGAFGVFLAGVINAGNPALAVIKEATVVFLILGHMKPLFFSFKGGKGVATALGALCILSPKLFLAILAVGVSIAGISGYVSLAAITLASLYPIATAYLTFISGGISTMGYIYIGISFVIASMILFSHRTNIKRLLNHEENSIYKNRRKSHG